MKQSDVIKIFVTSSKKKSKDGKRKWIQFRTKMNLIVKGEEEKGKQPKWVNLTFCGKELSEYAKNKVTRGYLHVKVSDIQYPKVYEITTVETTEDGKGKQMYPEVKIFNEFNFVEVLKDVENPFITDEKETEENEIEENGIDTETEDNFDSQE